jgi:glycosyltransferase involved in cell wall biosynthesis
MRTRLFVNGITLEEANLIPLLLKIKTWQSLNFQITIFGNSKLKKEIDSLNIIKAHEFVELKNNNPVNSKLSFIVEALKRNFFSIFHLKKFKKNFDVVYSISSVLDLVIFPYILKKTDKKIRWVAVFDNKVPFSDSGDKFIRLLAWFFFQVSSLFLKNADKVFAVSQDLKEFLLKRGFREDQVVVTGNAVETDLIKQSKRETQYNIDALFTGRINEAKGTYDLLNVLDIVRERYPDFQLAIMGKGDRTAERKFNQKIAQKGLTNNIQLLGFKSGIEKFNIIKSSKCFLFLSHSESFGVALLEAVCSGLPSLAYDLKPYKKIYKNNEVFIFKNKDINSVAQKIFAIFENNEFENKPGKLLLNEFTWEKIAEKEFQAMTDASPSTSNESQPQSTRTQVEQSA